MDLVLEAVRANPDNESVRRLLGYQKFQNQWHTNYEVKKYHSGMVWNDKFGWLPKSNVRRYEDGQRYSEGKWITAAEDAQRHGDINSGWVIETEHYSIRTNHSIEAGVALGSKLEDLYHLWEQMFIRYFASESDVIALFDGRARIQRGTPIQLKVVCFRDHDEYIHALQTVMPKVGISVGSYLDSVKTAYFFAGNGSDDRTIYHEATHQLFHESRKVAPNVGRKGNFWIIEGIAMYMESLKKENGYYELGGFDDQRMVAARYRLLHDHFYVPLEQLTGYGMEKLQNDPKIATLYSQSAGLTYFLLYYDHGRYRDDLVSYLTAVYTGRDGPDTLAQLTGAGYSRIGQTISRIHGKSREIVDGGQWTVGSGSETKPDCEERISESAKFCGLALSIAHPTVHFLLFIFHQLSQPDYVIAHDFQIGIKPQCAAEAFQGGDRIFQFQIGLAHARGGNEMIRIYLQALVAIANCVGQPAQAVMGQRPLMPCLGEPRAAFDQLVGAMNDFLELLGGVKTQNFAQFLAVLFAAHARPNRTNAVFGQCANGPVVVQKRPAHGVIAHVIAQKTQSQHGRAADFAELVPRQPLQRALRHNARKPGGYSRPSPGCPGTSRTNPISGDFEWGRYPRLSLRPITSRTRNTADKC